MPERSQGWYNQALRDLEQAIDSQKSDRHEWAVLLLNKPLKKR